MIYSYEWRQTKSSQETNSANIDNLVTKVLSLDIYFFNSD